MNKLIRRALWLCLTVLLLSSLTVSAFAQEIETPDASVLHNNFEQPPIDTSIPLDWFTNKDKEEPTDEETSQPKRDEDTLYAIVKVLNSVFRTPSFGTYTKNSINLRIKTQITITERIPTPPLINQMDYPKDAYGKYGSIASHGCGIACLTMAASYLLDEELDVVTMAEQFGDYNTEHGSYWILFEDSAEILGLTLQERTYNTQKVVEALQNGQIVIALQGPGLFTSGGHFILLTGITENGTIMVNDPNGYNWNKNYIMRRGFAEGFTQKQVFADGGPYWIYSPKEVTLETLNDERASVKYQLIVN